MTTHVLNIFPSFIHIPPLSTEISLRGQRTSRTDNARPGGLPEHMMLFAHYCWWKRKITASTCFPELCYQHRKTSFILEIILFSIKYGLTNTFPSTLTELITENYYIIIRLLFGVHVLELSLLFCNFLVTILFSHVRYAVTDV